MAKLKVKNDIELSIHPERLFKSALALKIIKDDSMSGWISDIELSLGPGIVWSGRYEFESFHRLFKLPKTRIRGSNNYTKEREGLWWGESERISNTTVCVGHCIIKSNLQIFKEPTRYNSLVLDDLLLRSLPEDYPLPLATGKTYSGFPYTIGTTRKFPLYMWFKPIYWQVIISTVIDSATIRTAYVYPIVTLVGNLNGVVGLKKDKKHNIKKSDELGSYFPVYHLEKFSNRSKGIRIG